MLLFQRVKPLSRILAEGSDENTEHALRRSLGPWALTAMGIGAIIGTGIFVLTGVGVGDARGPVADDLVRRRRARQRARRALLRRSLEQDPDLRKRLHVHVRDARRVLGVDHRLGSGARIRARRGDRQRRLVGLLRRTSCIRRRRRPDSDG